MKPATNSTLNNKTPKNIFMFSILSVVSAFLNVVANAVGKNYHKYCKKDKILFLFFSGIMLLHTEHL